MVPKCPSEASGSVRRGGLRGTTISRAEHRMDLHAGAYRRAARAYARTGREPARAQSPASYEHNIARK